MDPQQILQFPHAAAPAAGASLEVAPGLRWLRMPLPFALDHINLWLLEDGPGWTIVDCGIASKTTKSAWEQVFASAPASGAQAFRATRVLATHAHPDHIGLAHWLCEHFGVGLWISHADYLMAHAVRDGAAGHALDKLTGMFRSNGLCGEELKKMSQRDNHFRRAVPEFPQSFRRLMDGDEIRIGDRVWRVIMGYGHSPEHAALYSSGLGVLISGDMVLPRITTNVSVWAVNPDGDPLKLFLDSLKRYAGLPADTLVLPSHGLPFRGLHERIEQLEEHHRLRCAELLLACHRPLSAFAAVPALFRRELDTQQLFFALGEAMAHLHYLYFQGALERETGADGVIRYLRNTAPGAGLASI